MRKMLFVLMTVLLSVAWVAAQQPDSRQDPAAPPAQTGPATNADRPMPAPPDNSGQATPPSASASASQSSSSSGQVIEGCLGGTVPDFTVTDPAGMVYKLDIPKDADASQLTAHVGESVKVRGAVMGASDSAPSGKASAGSTPSDKSAASSAQHTIMVEQIGRGTGTCPAGAAKPSSK